MPSRKLTHTQKLIEQIMEQNPGISLAEAWEMYNKKYEDIELEPR